MMKGQPGITHHKLAQNGRYGKENIDKQRVSM